MNFFVAFLRVLFFALVLPPGCVRTIGTFDVDLDLDLTRLGISPVVIAEPFKFDEINSIGGKSTSHEIVSNLFAMIESYFVNWKSS